MRIFKAATLAYAALLIGTGSSLTLDAPVRPQARLPAADYASVSEAMRAAVRDLNGGDMAGAVQALEFAAKQGHPLALWKLGRMHASGEGVPLDDLKAFEFFSKIANDNADESPDSPNATLVSKAFVALGTYFLEGIKGTYVTANPQRAFEMFQYAASYYGNPDAQYNLARLYLEGTGTARDPLQGARWLNLAAAKGHAQAQALLGHLLVNGQVDARHRAVGIMWLTLAREAADPVKDQWISDLYQKNVEGASESDRQRALVYLEQFLKKKR